MSKAREWIDREEELLSAEQMLSYITNISINGADLILDRVFDKVGFNRIEDDLRRTGFSKEGRYKNPQITLGLLVSMRGYPLAYCIHEVNKYEGHKMLPAVTEFVKNFKLEDFIVVEGSGLMKRYQSIAPLFEDDF